MLYKYMTFERCWQLISTEFLKFSEPAELNDPYEMLPYVKSYDISIFDKIFKNRQDIEHLYGYLLARKINISFMEFKKLIKKPYGKEMILEFDRSEYKKWVKSFPNEIGKVFRICSLTTNYENILMWAHYAANFTGCVVEFDFSTLPNSNNVIKNVKYSKKGVPLDVIYYYKDKSNKMLMEKLLTTKSKDWKYELEKRIIIKKEDLKENISDQCIFYGIPNALRFVRKVVTGDKIELTNKSNIIELCKRKNIACFQSKLSETEYKVEIITE